MAKRTQHVALNNVAIVWPGLYNYRRRLTTKIKASASVWNNFAVNLPPKNKRRFAISHEQNNSFRLNISIDIMGIKFSNCEFLHKIFWKRTWPPSAWFHDLTCTSFEIAANKITPFFRDGLGIRESLKNKAIFDSQENQRNALPNLRRWLTTSSRVIMMWKRK